VVATVERPASVMREAGVASTAPRRDRTARGADAAVSPQPAAPGQRAGEGAALSTQCCVLVLADIAPAARFWGWSRIVRGAGALRAEPGLRFAKVLGSGHDGGFGLKPSASRQGLFLLFERPEDARNFIDRSPRLLAYRARARELLTLRLAAYSVRGSWSGTAPALAAAPPVDGPIAALTRASIRPFAAARFWRHAPPAQADLAHAGGCLLAVGLGEAPVLRQATFSLWDSVRSMDAYARRGAHLAAIRASASQGFFSESMFVRFVVHEVRGTWKGRVYGDDVLRSTA